MAEAAPDTEVRPGRLWGKLQTREELQLGEVLEVEKPRSTADGAERIW